jgi:hypothetical protein
MNKNKYWTTIAMSVMFRLLLWFFKMSNTLSNCIHDPTFRHSSLVSSLGVIWSPFCCIYSKDDVIYQQRGHTLRPMWGNPVSLCIPDSTHWISDSTSWIPDFTPWILDSTPWILDSKANKSLDSGLPHMGRYPCGKKHPSSLFWEWWFILICHASKQRFDHSNC